MSWSVSGRMRRQQPVADLAHRAAATTQTGHMVRGSPCARVRVSDGEGQSDLLQQRNVRRIIANVRALRRRHCQLHGQGPKVAQLIGAALDHMADAEVPTAAGHGGGAAPGNDGDRDARAGHALQSMAILDIEALQLLAARPVIHAPVGEHAIDIQNQQANDGRG